MPQATADRHSLPPYPRPAVLPAPNPQCLLALPHRERDELRLRCDELEEALDDRGRKISQLQAECGKLRLGATASASRAGGWPGSGEGALRGSTDPVRFTAKTVGAASLGVSAGADLSETLRLRHGCGSVGEMSASRRGNRRLALPTPTGEGSDEFARFTSVAMARKISLAARGFEVENVFIDQLFDDAKVR